ncbi:MAG: hypothetical protein MUF64_30920, partial [Polyangiaceae bacterium]|nr:hypothetical protein [Polyangiaceae bacterium]
MNPSRHREVRDHVGRHFDEVHRRRVITLNLARWSLGLALTGGAAYLLWAMKMARTFGLASSGKFEGFVGLRPGALWKRWACAAHARGKGADGAGAPRGP